MPEKAKDIFLCHAHEDKDTIVRPLYQALERAGVSCWLDEAEILWGESITRQIEKGLSSSRYILVVLSPSFAQKSYAQGEMRSALSDQLSTGEVRMLPLLVEPVGLEQFPLLRDTLKLAW